MSAKPLYIPYKALGYVIDGNPFVVNHLGSEIFLTVSIANAFQVYRVDRLTCCLVSSPVAGRITCVQTIGHETFVAVANEVIVYDRTKVVRKYSDHTSDLIGLILIGHLLLSYDRDSIMKVTQTYPKPGTI
jgi:U3 small nucleolar RNA-associated protein 21